MTRAQVVVSEVFHTHRVRPWRLVVGVTLLGSLIAAPAILDVMAADSLARVVREENMRGASVLVVEDRGGQLDSVDCARAASFEGVLHAGGVTEPDVVSIGEDALTSVRRVFASPGYLAITGYAANRIAHPYAVAGSTLGSEVSIQRGAEVALSDGLIVRWELVPAASRFEARSRWLTVPIPPGGSVQQCWVETTAPALSPVRAALSTLFPDARDLSIEVLRDPGVADSALRSWIERPALTLGVLGGATAGVAGGLLLWPRRPEFALYRLLGMRRVRAALFASAEMQALVAGAAAFAVLLTGTAGAFMSTGVESLRAGLPQLLVSYGMTVVISGVVAMGIASGRIAHILRNRT